MKKLFLALCLTVATICTVNAQKNDMAIGLRLGGNVEASFQMPVGGNRLEIDLGLSNLFDNHLSLNLAAAYQWVWNIAGISGFNWYVGPGAYLGIYDFKSFGIGVLGQIGLEYNFNFPLQLSLDYRPTLTILPDVGYYPYGFALGIRYRF